MEKIRGCSNCGKSENHNPNKRAYCDVGSEHVIGGCGEHMTAKESTCPPERSKWVPVRDIRKGKVTGKVVEFFGDIRTGIVIDPGNTRLSVGSSLGRSSGSFDYYTKLTYSEYYKYLPKEEPEGKYKNCFKYSTTKSLPAE